MHFDLCRLHAIAAHLRLKIPAAEDLQLSVSSDAPWQARAGLDLPRLVDLWRRPDSELRALIKGSAMTRAKLTGLRRNLAVAIGNSGDEDALGALREHRADQPSAADPIVTEHVDWAHRRPPSR